MSVYVVSYDLKAPGRNYSGLIRELKSSNQWWHYLESTWLIQSYETVNQLAARLRGQIDTNDRLLVAEMGRSSDGWLEQEAWEWINQRAAA